jgi:hypothetical protein
MGSLEEVDSYLATQGYTLERASGAGNNCFFYAIANALAGLPGSRLGLNDKNFAETLRADVAKLQRKNPVRYGRQVRDTPTAKVRYVTIDEISPTEMATDVEVEAALEVLRQYNPRMVTCIVVYSKSRGQDVDEQVFVPNFESADTCGHTLILRNTVGVHFDSYRSTV